MKMARLAALGTVVLFSLVACAGQPRPAAGPGTAAPPPPMRAQAGDTVYLVEHYIRAESRMQLEEFVEEVLWPAMQRTADTSTARGQVLRQTRMIRQIGPNGDGSYTYTFVLDPVVQGESYNVLEILREVYSEEEALQLYGRFTETWAREFTSRPFVQASEPPAR